MSYDRIMEERVEVVEEPVIEKKKPGRPPVEKPKMFKLTIHSGADNGDKGDVVLVHNYKQIQIKRDVEVEVSEAYIECLQHSMIETTVKNDAGEERKARVPRFSYNVSPA